MTDKKKKSEDAGRIAVIRIRGIRNVKPRLRLTFELMRLERPNHCVVVGPTPQTMGMLNVIKDYVTFGRINDTTFSALRSKRGKEGVENPVYRLHPPKRGMRDIKLAWPAGVVGAREDMDVFIKKMI